MKTLQALNAEAQFAEAGMQKAAASVSSAQQPAPAAEPVDSIEDQINTSMTQTLKALNTRQLGADDQDEGDDDKKGGFFSRFRKS